jgi:hypothetical protein
VVRGRGWSIAEYEARLGGTREVRIKRGVKRQLTGDAIGLVALNI